MARSTYLAFGDYHSALYPEIETQLGGGPGRADVVESAGLVASAPTRTVLDVGCGTGHHLATMLRAAPGAHGIGSSSTSRRRSGRVGSW